MTTFLGKSCSFCLPRVPFVNCRQFMYLVISLLVLRAGYGIWLYQFLIIAYLFTLTGMNTESQFCWYRELNNIWAATWLKQQSDCAPSEDSDQPGHLPRLIRVFAVRMKKAWVLSYLFSAQRRLWSDLADAQTDLSLRWAHTHIVGFVMSWLISVSQKS